jgi:hypothetical protein
MDPKQCDACSAELPDVYSAPLCESCMSELHASAGFADLLPGGHAAPPSLASPGGHAEAAGGDESTLEDGAAEEERMGSGEGPAR